MVLLPKPTGRPESPFFMKTGGCCLACGWAEEFKQRNPSPVATTTKDLLPSAPPEGVLL